MNWHLLSPETLCRIKEELLDYVKDVAKDMSNRDTRAHLKDVLTTLEEIDGALEAMKELRDS